LILRFKVFFGTALELWDGSSFSFAKVRLTNPIPPPPDHFRGGFWTALHEGFFFFQWFSGSSWLGVKTQPSGYVRCLAEFPVYFSAPSIGFVLGPGPASPPCFLGSRGVKLSLCVFSLTPKTFFPFFIRCSCRLERSLGPVVLVFFFF